MIISDVVIGVITAVVVIGVIIIGGLFDPSMQETNQTIQVNDNQEGLAAVFTPDVVNFCALIIITGIGIAIVSLLQKRGDL